MFNSLLINSGIPAAKVQALTGHSSLKMTEKIYYRPDDMRDVTNLVSGILETKPEVE
jgi:integrase